MLNVSNISCVCRKINILNAHCFIFAWNDFVEAALHLEREFQALGLTVTTLYSGFAVIPTHWESISQPYFTAKWNRSMELLESDTYIQLQADVRIENPTKFLERAIEALSDDRIGLYECDVDIGFIYDQSSTVPLRDDLYEVPMVDGLSFAMKSEIARKLPKIPLDINTLGWGITPALSAIGRLAGQHCVRDYRVKSLHRHERSYSKPEALAQREQWITTLDPSIRQEMEKIHLEMQRISRRNQNSL